MEKIIKQSVGIDCSQDKLDVSFGVMNENFDTAVLSTTIFKNEKKGWEKMLKWKKKLKKDNVEVVFVVEATGVYHEEVSLFLHEHDEHISVLLPNKVKNFARTLKTKTVTDKVSAQTIALLGLEKKLDRWQPPHPVFNTLRQLTREREQLHSEKTQILCQLHAEESGAWSNEGSIKRMKQRIKMIKKQIEEIENEIRQIINRHQWLKEKLDYVCSIKGVGLITAVTAAAETNGFNLVRNKKQLVSYAGLDIVEKQSGTSVKGKPRISRKGNKHVRKAMHFPALSAIRSDKKMKQLFVRLVSKHGIKMKAVVAVQRKLLELIYVLWKKNEYYNPDYLKKLEQPTRAALNEMA